MTRLSLLVLSLALAACTTPPASPPAAAIADTSAPAATLDAATLAGNHWRLHDASANGVRIDALLVRPQQPLTLDFGDGRVSVDNACNRISGSYTIKGSTLVVGQAMSTQVACSDPKIMALDGEIGSRLQGTLQAALTDANTLVLTTANGDSLSFRGEPTADTRYGGPGERVFLEVAAQTKPCSHPLIADMQCLQVREIRYDDNGLKIGTPGEYQHFYTPIEGYTHQAGTRNVLRVNRYTIKNPPADGSSVAYVLDMVVESALEP